MSFVHRLSPCSVDFINRCVRLGTQEMNSDQAWASSLEASPQGLARLESQRLAMEIRRGATSLRGREGRDSGQRREAPLFCCVIREWFKHLIGLAEK